MNGINIQNMKAAFVVEDFTMIAEAWSELLRSMGYVNIHIFDRAENVLSAVEEEKPEIILMDINLKGEMNGIELTRQLIANKSNCKVIILSMHNESFFIKSAFEAGAGGYVTKNSPLDELKEAIETVLSGETYRCSEIRG